MGSGGTIWLPGLSPFGDWALLGKGTGADTVRETPQSQGDK